MADTVPDLLLWLPCCGRATLVCCAWQDVKKQVDTAIEEVKAAPPPGLEMLWEHVYNTNTAGTLRGIDASIQMPVIPSAAK